MFLDITTPGLSSGLLELVADVPVVRWWRVLASLASRASGPLARCPGSYESIFGIIRRRRELYSSRAKDSVLIVQSCAIQ